jgi:hypothetical protein
MTAKYELAFLRRYLASSLNLVLKAVQNRFRLRYSPRYKTRA